MAVTFNIPEAVDRLINLIREHGKCVDAPLLSPFPSRATPPTPSQLCCAVSSSCASAGRAPC